jgi:hypothetical protein
VQRFVKCNRDKEAETQKKSHGVMVVLTRVAKFKENIASGVEFKQYFKEGKYFRGTLRNCSTRELVLHIIQAFVLQLIKILRIYPYNSICRDFRE